MDLYIDGKRIETPRLTGLERRLAARLAEADFGSLEAYGFASVRDDGWCGQGGLEYAEDIEWPDRRQLGALLTGLERKRLIVMDREVNAYRGPVTEIWFDCEALEGLAQA